MDAHFEVSFWVSFEVSFYYSGPGNQLSSCFINKPFGETVRLPPASTNNNSQFNGLGN